MNKPRVLTGIRPTGRLHLGHYVGALDQWVKIQDSNEYDCFFLIADAQGLTDHAHEPELIRDSVVQTALDWLSIGLDPKKSAFVVQSWIPETFELQQLLASITPETWVKANPTLKEEVRQLRERRRQTVTSAFMQYPVSQAADILLLSGANQNPILVPVGKDQLPHVELTREIARLFNRTYGETLSEPQSRISGVGRLVGTDGGAKMSKSLGNVIYLSDLAEVVKKKVMEMYTDPNRTSADIPGKVKGNPVFIYHAAFNPDKDEVKDLKKRYQEGRVGDVEVKEKLIEAINNFLDPIRKKRSLFEGKEELIREYLVDGTKREKKIAEETLEAVKKAMGLVYF